MITKKNLTSCPATSNTSTSSGSTSRPLATLSGGLEVMCDTLTDGGGWIIIQKRSSDDVDFFADWQNYTHGFGSLAGNFWLGLDNIHQLCPNGSSIPCEIRFDFRYEDTDYFAQYQNFSVADADDGFRLSVEGYTGNAGDSFSKASGYRFSTFDKDNDGTVTDNCAELSHAAWWYGWCGGVNLNGRWGEDGETGVYWTPLTYDPKLYTYHSVNDTEIKVRPRD